MSGSKYAVKSKVNKISTTVSYTAYNYMTSEATLTTHCVNVFLEFRSVGEFVSTFLLTVPSSGIDNSVECVYNITYTTVISSWRQTSEWRGGEQRGSA